MGIDYDAADAAPTSSLQLASFWGTRDSAVWQNTDFSADTQDLQKFGVKRYLRYGNLASNLDIKTYDVGNFFIASEDCADTSNIGILYVEYDVEFQTPQLDASALISSNSAKISATAPVKTNLFDGGSTITGGLPVAAAGNTITFNKSGQFLVEAEFTGTGLSAAPVTTGSTSTFVVDDLAIANAGVTGILIVFVSALPGQTFVMNWNTVSTTLTGMLVRVASYSYALQ